MSNHPFDPEKSKLYNALIDAVNRSPHFANIPLPAIIDNQLEELIQKFKYDQLPKEYHPSFDPPKEDEKDEKDLADGDEEVAAGDDAAIAGGEAGTGILDAIPGLDILGAIGGAVLAGIMSHREKMQEKAEQAVAPLTSNVDTQIGLSGSEALS